MATVTVKEENTARITRAAHALIIAIVVFALMPQFAFGAASPSRSDVATGPRLASLEIQIWPEFDRRGAALVMLQGELAAEVTLPAAVALRIPASSGGPTAVAFASAAGTELFNLNYERADTGNYITLRLQAPQRVFHIEFYDPIAASTSERSYNYVWPGDLAVGQLRVRIQEPARASEFSVRPEFASGIAGADGLLYRTAEFEAFNAGKPLPIEIRYTKTEETTSAEILGLKSPDSTSPAAGSFGATRPVWYVGLAGAGALSVVVVAGFAGWWWRRRGKKTAEVRRIAAGYCPHCGGGLAAGDRFCSKCGAPVREKNSSASHPASTDVRNRR